MESKGFDNNKAMAYFVNRVKGGPMLKAANKTRLLGGGGGDGGANATSKRHNHTGVKSDALPGIIAAGHKATNSYKWYLNHGCDNFETAIGRPST